MYTAFYGFKERPFNIISDPGFLYMSPRHRMAFTYLEYGLMDAVGFILLTGEIGAGKTTLIKHLVKQVPGDVEVAVVFNTNVSAQELLELLLDEFELVPQGKGKSKALDALNAFLIGKHAMGQRVLVIVDEAQNLSQEALEEVRMLSNLQTDKASLLQILLSGQPSLRQRLQDPALSQLSQRIAVSYHLGPLDRDEVAKYIAHRVNTAGRSDGAGALFSSDAVSKIADWSGGLPRSINILCDAALVYGYADGLEAIDGTVVDAVIRDRAESGVIPASTEVESGEAESGGAEPIPAAVGEGENRIRRLEQQVERLTALVEWHIRALENQAESYKDTLVARLEDRLSKERARCDKLLVQYNLLKDRLNNKRQASPKRESPKQDKRAEGAASIKTGAQGPWRIAKTETPVNQDPGWMERVRNWFAR